MTTLNMTPARLAKLKAVQIASRHGCAYHWSQKTMELFAAHGLVKRGMDTRYRVEGWVITEAGEAELAKAGK